MAYIILIDDDRDDIELITSLISQLEDNSVKSFTEPEKAYSWLHNEETTEPDAIFIDYSMPKVNGLEVLKKIRSARCCMQSTIVLLSTAISPIELSQCLAAGANRVEVKPSSLAEFKSMIVSVLHDAEGK